MFLYLDTSSLVKLYVEEKNSRTVSTLVTSSRATATSLIAYTEARAAFARRFREKAFTARAYKGIISSFNKDWDNYLMVQVTRKVVLLAGDLAEKHRLKSLDAIHLSSALTLSSELSSPIIFSCSDNKLQKASEVETLYQPA